MAATAESIGVAPFELDEAEAGITEHTMERMSDVQALIDEGESEEDIARLIASHDDFTQAERVLAKIVLRRHGLARGS
jgi:hypothetical protein